MSDYNRQQRDYFPCFPFQFINFQQRNTNLHSMEQQQVRNPRPSFIIPHILLDNNTHTQTPAVSGLPVSAVCSVYSDGMNKRTTRHGISERFLRPAQFEVAYLPFFSFLFCFSLFFSQFCCLNFPDQRQRERLNSGRLGQEKTRLTD